MLYSLLRPVAATALRLYYRHIEAVGVERIPPRGPVLLAVNHPNALVDALVVGTLAPRRVYMTAKATLFANPVASRFLRAVGVIPLRRAKDEGGRGQVDPGRNTDAFRAVNDALLAGQALMIFPEGISHDEPSLAPLRTGTARMALQARDESGVRGLTIVPIGLVFSRKDAPRSRILMEVGEPIDFDGWTASHPGREVDQLTADIEARLRAVTLNFDSLDDAAQATALAGVLARILTDAMPSLERGAPPMVDAAAITRRIEEIRRLLPSIGAFARERVTRFVGDMQQFDADLRARGLHADELTIADDAASGVTFIVRESWIVLVAGPIAVWGALNHWLPIRAARIIGQRGVASATDPAMRTIVAGAALLAASYAIQGAVIARIFGTFVAILYVASLPLTAEINYRLRERWRRALRRARAFLLFRRDPGLRDSFRVRAAALRAEARALDVALSGRS